MDRAPNLHSLSALPGSIPIFPLAGALLLPRTQLPLNVFEPRYLAMVNDALASHRMIGMTQPMEDRPQTDDRAPPVYEIGCAGKITSFAEIDDGRMLIMLTGVARFSIVRELAVTTPYRQVEPDYSAFSDDLKLGHGEELVNRQQVLTTFRAYLKANDLKTDWSEIRAASNELLVNSLSTIAPFAAAEKQALLEAPSLTARAELLVALTEINLKRSEGGSSRRLQ
jgi:Lon protease-like protein